MIKKISFATLLATCLVMFLPKQTYAGAIDWNRLYGAIGSSGGTISIGQSLTIGTVITALLRYIFPIAGILLLLYMIYGGFLYMTSGGTPQSIQNARGIITTALLGFAIIFVAYWIVQLIGIILGVGQFYAIFN